MILFLRSNSVNPDPRLQKYIDFCIKNDLKYHVIAWDRLSEGLTDNENFTYFKKKSSYGGGISNAYNLILWNFFLLKKCFFLKKKTSAIHSCDLDTGLIASIFRLFKIKIIYDIFDWYGDSRGGKLRPIFNFLERYVVKSADHVIVCDEGRIKQIGFVPDEFSILPNIPTYDCLDISSLKYNISKDCCSYSNKKINLTYVGILTTDRHLDVLLALSKKIDENQMPITLTIAGFGVFSESFSEASSKSYSLNFKGKIQYSEAQNIILNSDLMFAFYDKNIINNVFAAPNKFYESLALQTPLITNPGTLLSDKILAEGCGYLVLPTVDKIYDFLSNLNLDDVKLKKSICEQVWRKKYKDYNETYFSNVYKKLVVK